MVAADRHTERGLLVLVDSTNCEAGTSGEGFCRGLPCDRPVKSVRFHDEARIEFVEQVIFYEAASLGLSEQLNIEIENAPTRLI